MSRKIISHGCYKSREYNSWDAMMQRCINPNHQCFHYYGGRGITVCDEWLFNFEQFYADMGDCADGLTLDRVDNDAGYNPDNCRWATKKEQMRNTRQNRNIEYQGKTQCLAAWAENLNINPMTLRNRINRGWTIHDAFTRKLEARSARKENFGQ